jgi:hypothetical protein
MRATASTKCLPYSSRCFCNVALLNSTQWYSVVLSGTQWYSVVLSGTQWYSVLRYNHGAVCMPRHATVCQTAEYAPPEALFNAHTAGLKNSHSPAYDVWSAAVRIAQN